MSDKKPQKIYMDVQGESVSILKVNNDNYISLTDLTKKFEGQSALIEQWLRNKDTLLFLGTWEFLNNQNFNSLEFEGIKNEAGRNSFYLSIKKWIETTGAIGIISTAGRYGGTYAHKDIAFEFCSWLSPEFKLYLIKEFQRLKIEETKRQSLDWNLNRTLSKINYKIHTDSIKDNIIPHKLTKKEQTYTYANEADVLNVALFGITAKQWREKHPEAKGNIRDYASIEQLLVLANIESMNAELITQKLPQDKRLAMLNEMAIRQLKSLISNNQVKTLEKSADMKMIEDKSIGEN